MKSVKEVSIDNKQYRIEPYITSRGLRLLKTLTGLVGEPAVRLMATLPKGTDVVALKNGTASILEVDINLEKAAEILSASLVKLDDNTTEQLFKDVLQNTFHNNTSCAEKFDSHFQGEYLHLFKVVVKTLEAQFGDFLSAITGGVLKRPVKGKA